MGDQFVVLAWLTYLSRRVLIFMVAGIALASQVYASSQTSEQQPAELIGAVCVIRHDNQLVMLSEVITRKISLPGGYIDPGETPAQAAAREVFEETGIEVEVGERITYRGRASIHSCVAKTPILVSSFRDYTGYPIVASWFSKHYAKEVSRVYLVDPQTVMAHQYRYPDDIESLSQWLNQTPESEIEVYAELSNRVHSYHQLELEWIKRLQRWTDSFSPLNAQAFEGLMWVLNLPGEAEVVALLLVAVTVGFGPRAMLQLFVILVLTLLTSSLIKLGLASPRPSDIIPQLQKVNAYGFGLPSGHTLIATVLWGMGWYWLSRRVSPWLQGVTLCLLPLLIGGQALARVWYGVHFISDIVVSILLGLILIALCMAWHSAQRYPLPQIIANRGFWLMMALCFGLTAGITHMPDHTYLFAASVGLVLVIDQLPGGRLLLSTVTRARLFVFVPLGLVLIGVGTESLANMSSVSLMVLVIRAVGCALGMMWLVGASSVIIGRQQEIPAERG
ncbi:bifunctional NUDIX hydrolase/phosphatase PAP2 family protein [Photobacterium atrarenae]|uniref:undecaprenyl-diphosphate phosphatase n=1 Tax=Photobacterium atrarenae TaxID=865757 RepID=A0ABY5GBV4_9GAMM|nr:phosphatase PAP2 family protein [Photobacterium atrarenae]UTV26677.1 phosphatase PAP2 family protein [Photobacterium atrarenae]